MVPAELPRDLPSFLARFATDAQCRAYLFAQRWPEGFGCTGCGHGVAYSHRRRLIDECAACGKQHSLLAGTIFEQTKTGLARWFLAIWLVTSSKGGISAVELQRQMGFSSYQTAWSWLHKIRRAMVHPERRPLAHRVEADETLVGGAQPGKPGRGAASRRWSPVRSRRHPARAASAGAAGCGSRPSPTPRPKAWRPSSPRTWPRPPRRPPTAGRAMPGWARPATPTTRSISAAPRAGLDPRRYANGSTKVDGATPCCACPPSTSSSALPSAGCPARLMARSARSICRPTSTSTSSACMGLRVSSFECRHRVPSCVEFISVAAAQPRFGARRSEGSSPSGADHRATSLYPVDP